MRQARTLVYLQAHTMPGGMGKKLAQSGLLQQASRRLVNLIRPGSGLYRLKGCPLCSEHREIHAARPLIRLAQVHSARHV